MTYRIGLLSCPAGNGNLGDEVLVASVIQNIRRYDPNTDIAVYCSNPEDVEKRHRITAYPVTRIEGRNSTSTSGKISSGLTGTDTSGTLVGLKTYLKTVPVLYPILKAIKHCLSVLIDTAREVVFLAESYKAFRGTNLLLVTGSGVLSDHFGGASNFPYLMVLWTMLAKVSGAKVAFLSCGAGPLNSGLSRYLIRKSLELADYRSFRDEGSKRLIEEIGIIKNNPVFPDLAYSFLVTDLPAPNPSRNSHTQLVGINPFPHMDNRYWPESDLVSYRSYVNKLALFASWLLENNYKICFFPTQIRSDPFVIEDVKNDLTRLGVKNIENIIEHPVQNVSDLLSAISGMDLVVATRFHGILLSFLLNKPVLAISNHPKMDHLMVNMGQGDFLLDIRHLNLENLIGRFLLLDARSPSIKRKIDTVVLENRTILQSQYSAIFHLLLEQDKSNKSMSK